MPTPVQLMFEAICDVFGWDPAVLPKSAKTRVGKVGRELREVGATPDMVRFSRGVLDEQFGLDTKYGPEAIALWWGEIEKRWHQRQRALRRRETEHEELHDGPPTPEELEANRQRWRQMMSDLGQTEVLKSLPE